MSSARFFILVSALAASTFGACTVETDSDGSSGGPSAGGASSSQVSSCKSSCDKMKFFQCSSAGEQARCYSDCDSAASASIEVFIGCAQNSICDPDCRTSIQPTPEPGQPAQPPSGSVATPDSCSLACDKAIQCSFLPLGAKAACAQECAVKAYQYQIDCVLNNACEQIRTVCGEFDVETGGGGETGGGETGGGETGGGGTSEASVLECQSACDKLNFFECVSASDHSACRDRCAAAAENERASFSACSFTGGGECAKLQDCFEVFRD